MALTPRGYQTVSLSSTTAAYISQATDALNNASVALIRVEGGNTRWRDDGTAATSATGFPLNDGDVMEYENDIDRLNFARTGASTVTVHVSLY